MFKSLKARGAESAMVDLAAEFAEIYNKIDPFVDWHVPLQDFGMDDRNIVAQYKSIKNPCQSDHDMFNFLLAIPEWLRICVIECHDYMQMEANNDI